MNSVRRLFDVYVFVSGIVVIASAKVRDDRWEHFSNNDFSAAAENNNAGRNVSRF